MSDVILQKLIARIRATIDLPNVTLSSGYYYSSLPLAVTDSIFSIGARYEAVVNAVQHLVRRADWGAVYRPRGSPYPPTEKQRTMSDLLAEFSKVAEPAEIFGNRGYANPAAKRPTPKAVLVRYISKVLVDNRVETFNDFAAFPDPEALDRTLRGLPSMSSGVAISYLRMLCGSDDSIKPDRHIHAFIRAASGGSTTVFSDAEAARLMQTAARSLAAEEGLHHITPRLLDHAVWRVQRQTRDQMPDRTFTNPKLVPPLGGAAASYRGPLSMEDFWRFCVQGGTTDSGLRFDVDEQERLHIVSPRSTNKNYKITKATVARYMAQANEARFRRDHGWFCKVYDFAITQR